MPAVNVASISGVMKERIEPQIAEIFAWEDFLCGWIPPGEGKVVSDRAMRIEFRTVRGGQTNYVDLDGGANALGTGHAIQECTITTTSIAHARQITRQAIAATASGEQAIESAMTTETGLAMKSLKAMLDKEMQRSISGEKAILTVDGGGGTYSVHDLVTPANTPFGAYLIEQGNAYHVYAAALNVLRAGGPYTILAVDYEARTIVTATFAAPTVPAVVAGYAANDRLVMVQPGATTPTVPTGAFAGLEQLVSHSAAGTWQTMARTNEWTRCREVDAGGAQYDLDHGRLLLNKIIMRKGGETLPKELVPYTHVAQKHSYERLVQAVMEVSKGSGNEAADLYLGDNLKLAGRRLRTSTNADPTKIQFLERSAFGWAATKKLEFYKTPNGDTIHPVYGANGVPSNSFWFQIDGRMQLYCKDVTNMGYVRNLGQPAGYYPTP